MASHRLPTETNVRPSASQLLAIGASAGVFALLLCIPYSLGYGQHRSSIASYLPQAWGMEQWQHCWLVLPVVVTIIWTQRKELAAIPWSGSWLGLPVIFVGLLFYFAGHRVDNIYLAYAGLQILFPGVVLWVAGREMAKRLLFVCGFLIFLWPLFFLEQSITFPLRMIMAKTSAGVLNFAGLAVIREGTGILSAPDPLIGLPAGKHFSIDVADPCSGIRSLFALMMVSSLYGYFTLRRWWEKWVLFLCSIPLAIAGNLVRILALTMATVAFGPEFAIGKSPLTDPSWFHMGAGYLVFAVALGGVIGCASLLNNAGSLREKLGKTIQIVKREARTAALATTPPLASGAFAVGEHSILRPDSEKSSKASASSLVSKPPRQHRPESPY